MTPPASDDCTALLIRSDAEELAGRPREALALLDAWLAARPSPYRLTEGVRVAVEAARLTALMGRGEEALAWLRRAGPPRHGRDSALACLHARIALAWHFGRARGLMRGINQLLAARPTDVDIYVRSLHTAARAAIASSCPAAATACMVRLARVSAPAVAALAGEIRAELAWHAALLAWTRSLVSRYPAPGYARPPGVALDHLRRSAAEYGSVLEAPSLRLLTAERVAAGRARARLLIDPTLVDQRQLERWFVQVEDMPLPMETDAARLALAAASLAAGDASTAADWFLRRAPERYGAPVLELYLAAHAFEAAGDSNAALICLKRRCREWESGGARALLVHEGTIRQAGARELVERALQSIRERPEEAMRIESWATALGVSRRTLEYAFRTACQTSPKRAADAWRLKEAERRLAADAGRWRTSLEEISRDCGFSSYQAFARAVRAHYALSPRHWHPHAE